MNIEKHDVIAQTICTISPLWALCPPYEGTKNSQNGISQSQVKAKKSGATSCRQ